MVRRRIERVEIVPDRFDIGAVGHGEAQRLEDLRDAVGDLRDRMAGAESLPLARLGQVESGVPGAAPCQCGLLRLDDLRQLVLQLVGGLAEHGTFFGGDAAQLLHDLRKETLAAKVFNTHCFQRRRIRRGLRIAQCLLLKFDQVLQIHFLPRIRYSVNSALSSSVRRIWQLLFWGISGQDSASVRVSEVSDESRDAQRSFGSSSAVT